MRSPQVEVLAYGVFDSNVKFPKIKITKERLVEAYELELYTADCSGKACIDDVWCPLSCGTFICAKPGQRRKSQLPFHCHYIHVAVYDLELQQLLNQIPNKLTLEETKTAAGLIHEMLSVESPELPENRLLLTACLFRLIGYLAQYRFLSEDAKPGISFSHQKTMLAAEAYIREHLGSPLPLAALAEFCSLSPTYFHTLFTDFFQKTPAQYILSCRIAKAKTLLLMDRCALSEVAGDCGFSSQSYFSYQFKQATGKTPLQYRREMLGRLKL